MVSSRKHGRETMERSLARSLGRRAEALLDEDPRVSSLLPRKKRVVGCVGIGIDTTHAGKVGEAGAASSGSTGSQALRKRGSQPKVVDGSKWLEDPEHPTWSNNTKKARDKTTHLDDACRLQWRRVRAISAPSHHLERER